MAYADFEYYATEFYGTAIDEDAFPALLVGHRPMWTM